MRRLAWLVAVIGLFALASLASLAAPVEAQDYRGRVQGTVTDSSQAALPGATVTLLNEATGVAATATTDEQGRYLFDFVEPGTYSVSGSLGGFKAVELQNIRVQQRATLTVDLPMEIGGVEERVVVEAPPVTVQFKSGSAELNLERQLIDQAPIAGRNPYNLSNIDPTIVVSPGTNENRPYHHAYANDYDAGGGTRRGNDVLLDGVPLVASYKTAYTPAVDAVEEITVSKTSVDAENGHSLGGIISLNMKSGTNEYHGSAYVYNRDPSMNAMTDPTIRVTPGQNTRSLRGTELKMYGATFGFPIERNKIFSFTSFEQWDDLRPLSIVRTVPTEAERRGDFSQSVLNGRVRTIYNPFTSTVDPASRLVVRQPFEGNRIPSTLFDPAALKMLNEIPLPNQPGNVDNWQGAVYDATDYWNLSQRVDVNLTDNWKMFVRYGQFKANLYQQNPTDAGFFPLSGSNRYGLSIAGDSVWVMSKRTTLNVRGSFYNMTDEFFNPSLLLGDAGLQDYWPNNPWYSSLYNSGYVYYPALDVTSGTTTGTGNRLGRQGREWFQHPDAWTISTRVNRYQGRHTMKWGGEVRAYYGEAARFEPINLAFTSALTAQSSDTPDIVNSGNQWASFLIGALDGQTSARLVPLQTPRLMGYSAYVQDDFEVSDRLTLNLGLRWEFEPGPTDTQNRLSQRYDLTQPIPEMQATPPDIPAQARQLMASKGYDYRFNGAWVFASEDNPHAWHASPTNFLPRVGVNYRLSDNSVARFAYARYMMPTINVRDTLGDFVNQYTGYGQTTFTLDLAGGRPQQTLANPYPANNPVIEPYDQAYGRYTGLGGAISLDQYELRPQINDRFNVSYQKQVWWGTTIDLSYFYNLGTRVPYNVNLNMADPAFRYEQKTLLNTQVPNPFFGYLTPDKFPGALRNNRQVTLGSLLVPYPQYGDVMQTNTNGRQLRTHTVEIRGQRPFAKGLSFLAAYAWNHERIQETLDNLAQYRVLTSGGEDGWEWRPTDLPVHRFTTAVTWQLPIGRDRAFLSTLPAALDYAIGGWQYTAAMRYYSGRPLFFGNFVVNGNPKLDDPTRDRWFDTSLFSVQDSFTPRSNPSFYDGLNGPSAFFADMTVTKVFPLRGRARVEARIEAYNAFNTIVWDNPDLNLASSNFGKVTRKRTDGQGREIQIGVRFAF